MQLESKKTTELARELSGSSCARSGDNNSSCCTLHAGIKSVGHRYQRGSAYLVGRENDENKRKQIQTSAFACIRAFVRTFSGTLSLSVRVCARGYVCMGVPIWMNSCLCAYAPAIVHVRVCVYACAYVQIYVCPRVCAHVSVHACLGSSKSVSARMYEFVVVCRRLPLRPCASIVVCECMFVCMILCLCAYASVFLRVCIRGVMCRVRVYEFVCVALRFCAWFSAHPLLLQYRHVCVCVCLLSVFVSVCAYAYARACGRKRAFVCMPSADLYFLPPIYFFASLSSVSFRFQGSPFCAKVRRRPKAVQNGL